ncbi:TPA: hypothetical protein N0F65_005960 [Lagenidium giganteum]|uniref:Non-specific serine/threonine protein kinase n=1 Tax=Lagenidium giganteum TaxID=4803 RepID=A0AAV2Z7G6_9STRA|nr:TPA: hypothetical protein N0F65_005960 [Lagenidium giganteum]
MYKTPAHSLALPHTARRRSNAGREHQQPRVSWFTLLCIIVCCLYVIDSLIDVGPGNDAAHHAAITEQQARQAQEAALLQEKQRSASESIGFRDEKKIVVLITSFRDAAACAEMLATAHRLAFRPERVHYRVYDEFHVGREDSCLRLFCAKEPSLCQSALRSRRLQHKVRDFSGTRGVSVGKHLVEGMVSAHDFDNQFYLSVSSRAVFSSHWDLLLLKQWYATGNDHAILSVAPKSIVLKHRTNSTMLLQCSARIHAPTEDAVVEFNPPEPIDKASALYQAPILQAHYSEHFHFGPVMALLTVRSDPYLAYMNVGFEFARAARFWTHGYDFYAPVGDILFANYAKRMYPVLEGHDAEVAKARRRVRRLLKLPVSFKTEPLEEEKSYALGSNRSFSRWTRFTAIDPLASFNESTNHQFTTCDQHLHYGPAHSAAWLKEKKWFEARQRRQRGTNAAMNVDVVRQKLLDGDTDVVLKELVDLYRRAEILHTPQLTRILEALFPIWRNLLQTKLPPQTRSTQANRCRKVLLQIINRLPSNDALRPYVTQLLHILMDVLNRDNEENSLIALKTIFDLHRNFRPALRTEVQPFLDIVQQMYKNIPQTMKKHFTELPASAATTPKATTPAMGTAAAAAATAVGASGDDAKATPSVSPSAGSVGAAEVAASGGEAAGGTGSSLSVETATASDDVTTDIPSSSPSTVRAESPICSSQESFKTVSELPLIIMLLFQCYPNYIESYIPVLVPLMMNTLSLQAPEGVARTHPAQYVDFLDCQVKTLSFVTYLLRGCANLMRPFQDSICESTVKLLIACPDDAFVLRKDIFVAARHIISTDFRRGFYGQLEQLMDDDVLIGKGRCSIHQIRPLAYSTLADMIHHVRDMLTLSQVSKIVEFYGKRIHDPTLPISIQTTSIRLLLNLVDISAKNEDADGWKGRNVLSRMLLIISAKFRTTLTNLPIAILTTLRNPADRSDVLEGGAMEKIKQSSLLPSAPMEKSEADKRLESLLMPYVKDLRAYDALPDEESNEARNRLLGVFFRYLTGQPMELVTCSQQALSDVIQLNKQSKDISLPKELLQQCLRPILLNLADYRNLTLPLLDGLSRLLSLLSSCFNVTLGEKLLEHLRQWRDPERIINAGIWKRGEEPLVAAAIIDLFHLLPPNEAFVEPLVNCVVDLEGALSRFGSFGKMSSPYRMPLTKFLNRYASTSVAFFLKKEHLTETKFSTLFQQLIKSPEAAPLRALIVGDGGAEMVVTATFMAASKIQGSVTESKPTDGSDESKMHAQIQLNAQKAAAQAVASAQAQGVAPTIAEARGMQARAAYVAKAQAQVNAQQALKAQSHAQIQANAQKLHAQTLAAAQAQGLSLVQAQAKAQMASKDYIAKAQSQVASVAPSPLSSPSVNSQVTQLQAQQLHAQIQVNAQKVHAQALAAAQAQGLKPIQAQEKAKQAQATYLHRAKAQAQAKIARAQSISLPSVPSTPSASEGPTSKPQLEALELHYQGLRLVRTVSKIHPAWLASQAVIVDCIRKLWRSPARVQRLSAQDRLPIKYHTESKLMVKCLINYSRVKPEDVQVLLDMLSVFLHRMPFDFTFLQDFYRDEVARTYSPSNKRALIRLFLRMLRDPGASEALKVHAIQMLIMPVLVTSFEDPNVENSDVMDPDTIMWMLREILASKDYPSDTMQSLRIELLKLGTLLIQHMSKYVTEHRKEVIKFAWNHLKAPDLTSKLWAYVNVCRFISVYDTPPKIVLQVYVALLRTYEMDSRFLVRKAFDILLPALPSRLPSNEFIKAIKWTKKIAYEEGHILAQLVHIWFLIVRHPALFYPFRGQFIPLMVNSLNRLAIPPSSTPDNRRLAVGIVDLIISWEQTRIERLRTRGSDCLQRRGVDSKRLTPTAADSAEGTDAFGAAKKRKTGDDSAEAIANVGGEVQPSVSPSSGRNTSEDDFEMNGAMVDLVINFAFRFALASADKQETSRLSKTCGELFDKAIKLWPTVSIRFSYFDKLIAVTAEAIIRQQQASKAAGSAASDNGSSVDSTHTQPSMPHFFVVPKGAPLSSLAILDTVLGILTSLVTKEVIVSSGRSVPYVIQYAPRIMKLLEPCFDRPNADIQSVLTKFLARIAELYPPSKAPQQLVACRFYPWLKEIINERLQAAAMPAVDSSTDASAQNTPAKAKAKATNVEDDLRVGLSLESVSQPESRSALQLEALGCVHEAQEEYFRALSKAQAGRVRLEDVNLFELRLWEERWVECAKQLCQWQLMNDFAKSTQNQDLLLDCAWKRGDWNSAKQILLSPSMQSVSEQGCPETRLQRLYISILDGEKRATVEGLVNQTAELALHQWQTLPTVLSRAHIPMMHVFHKFVEVKESIQMMADIKQASQLHTLPNLKPAINTWRERLPNKWEPILLWDDILTWRSHMFQVVKSTFSWSDAQMLACIHDTPWSVIKLAHTARKQHLPDVCLGALSKLYSVPAMDVQDAFSKLREQVSICYESSTEYNGGLSILNNTNLDYFSLRQKAEMFRLKALFLEAMGKISEANQTFSHCLQICDGYGKGWLSWGHYCYRLFMERKDISFASQTIACYLQAIHHRCNSARLMIARVLWLLSMDDEERKLIHSFEAHGKQLPIWIWIIWIPQLLVALGRPEAPQIRGLLRGLSAKFPQALYYTMRAFFLENRENAMLMGEVAKQHSGPPTPSGGSGSSMPPTPTFSSSVGSSSQGDESGAAMIYFRTRTGSVVAVPATTPAARLQEIPGLMGPSRQSPAAFGVSSAAAISLSAWLERSAPHPEPMKPDITPVQYTEDLLNFLRRSHDSLTSDMECMLEEMIIRFRPEPEEELLTAVHALLLKCYQLPRLTKTEPIPRMLRATLAKVCKKFFVLLPHQKNEKHIEFVKRFKDRFERDFAPAAGDDITMEDQQSEGAEFTLYETMNRLKSWKSELQAIVRKIGKRNADKLYMEDCSRHLIELSNSSVEVPGQYIADSEPIKDLHARIVHFDNSADVLLRNGYTQRRVAMGGSDGRTYFFLVQYAMTHITRTDERMMQTYLLLNRLLVRHKETKKRNTIFHVPKIIPLTPRVRLLEDSRDLVTLGEIYEMDCKLYDKDPDFQVELYRERLSEAYALSTPDSAEPEEECIQRAKAAIFNEICEQHVSETLLAKYIHGVCRDSDAYFQFRGEFTKHLALSSFLSYALFVGDRPPHRVLFSRRTGRVVSTELRPGYASSGILESTSAMPFRLTRNLHNFITRPGVQGPFSIVMSAAAEALMSEEDILSNQLCLFFRDDLMSWHASKSRIAPTELGMGLNSAGGAGSHQRRLETQVNQRVEANVALVLERVRGVSLKKDAETPRGKSVRELIEIAASPERQREMYPTWYPWL